MPSLCARDIYQFVPRQKEGIQKRYTIPRHFHMKTYHPLVLSSQCPGRVVDILEACGAFDPGSNPGRGVIFWNWGIAGSTVLAGSGYVRNDTSSRLAGHAVPGEIAPYCRGADLVFDEGYRRLPPLREAPLPAMPLR